MDYSKTKSKIINNSNINISWIDFFTNDILNEIQYIENNIGINYTPSIDKIFKVFENDLNKIKLVIVGQDPYPQKGVATGRCFEVGGLTNWNQKFRQTSLRNIIRLLYKSYYGETKKFSEIRSLNNMHNILLPPNELFKQWEKQGVLLLNINLTCEIGCPNSHSNIWYKFSNALVNFISIKNNSIKWFLWGSVAKKLKESINENEIYTSNHPMICNEKNPNDFLNSNCFNETSSLINWLIKEK